MLGLIEVVYAVGQAKPVSAIVRPLIARMHLEYDRNLTSLPYMERDLEKHAHKGLDVDASCSSQT